MTTFFTPSGANTSGLQRIGTDISLITSTDRLLIGLSSTDLASTERFVANRSLYIASASINAILCGLSTVGGVASVVATATGSATAPDLLFYVPTERMRLTTSSGQLAIGLTVPTAQLHVKEAADGYGAKFERNAGVTYGINLTTALATVGNVTSHPLSIVTNNTNAIYIDTAQKVAVNSTTAAGFNFYVNGTSAIQTSLVIGTTSAAPAGTKLLVEGGSLKVENVSSDASLTIATSGETVTLKAFNTGAGYVGTTSNASFSLYSNNIERVTLIGNGNFQIGQTADQSFGFYVEGTSKLKGAVTYSNTLTTTDFTKQVSIGITKFGSSAAIDASALVEMLSTTQGMLLPRMTTAQKNAISSPAEGLVVYDTTLHKACVRTAAAWETITSA